ncbi:trypsin-1-like protein [Leptotrombidium deliense]|uniref:Trypsin-1-like protein n=1 Tax=Leptotrombidium deliense TaxID=299467 RepID=A0A443SFD3_9ACAR|nr:trypsin-1-like protein [Leptotrombidium deliense]
MVAIVHIMYKLDGRRTNAAICKFQLLVVMNMIAMNWKFHLIYYLLISFDAIAFSEQCSCGIQGTGRSGRIILGDVVPDGKYPWMTQVKIQTANGRRSFCSGSIINNHYILTAAHCVYDAVSVYVAYGSNKKPTSGVYNHVNKIIVHQNFDRSLGHNDIALLKLKNPIKFTWKIKPICLPPANADQSGSLTVAGWGLTETGSTSKILLEASISELDQDSCKRAHAEVSTSQFCAGGSNKGACRGDSGSPLMKIYDDGKTIVVGIVSYGDPLCISLRETVYTKVTSFLDWIASNTKDAVYCLN